MTKKILEFPSTAGFKGYKQFFSKESVSHPAKMNLNLLYWIIENFTEQGDVIVDPMAGIGSTGVLASLLGRDAVCLDLEERFVKMMRENKELTDSQASLTEKGEITVLRGDARMLSKILGIVDIVVTSPPYEASFSKHNEEFKRIKKLVESGKASKELKRKYNDWLKRPEKNLGCQALYEGRYDKQVDSVITSPPYSDLLTGGGQKEKKGFNQGHTQGRHFCKGGYTPEVDAIVTSPPYSSIKKGKCKSEDVERWATEMEKRYTPDQNGGENRHTPGRLRAIKTMMDGYGKNKENIGNLPHGDINAVITSPPYEDGMDGNRHKGERSERIYEAKKWKTAYAEGNENIGNLKGSLITLKKFGRKDIDETILRDLYCTQKKTMQEIANLFGFSRTCIRNNIHRYKIRVLEQWERYFDGNFKDLSIEQQQLLFGGLLGDSNIFLGGAGSKYHQLRLCHSDKQHSYLKWKINLLNKFFKAKPHKREDERGIRWDITSVSHPIFRKLHKIFYETGRKRVAKSILEKLDDFGLAVWFMDDGHSTKANLTIATESFTLEEHNIMVSWFKEKYGLEPKIYLKANKYYYLNFNADDSRTLADVLSPFVLPLFRYKLELPDDRSLGAKKRWKREREKKQETYVSAMRQVYAEMYAVLKPSGKAVIVVKNFIRNKKVVDLASDTIKLCESVGFKLVDHILFKLPQLSFWRILYKRKFPEVDTHGIEYEHILVFKKGFS